MIANTMKSYLMNPNGTERSPIGNTLMKQTLDTEFEKILGLIRFGCFIKDNRYLIYALKIPSTTYEKISYDVVLEFDLNTISSSDISINNAMFRCFSNNPSFVYSFAYLYYKENLICDWLINKYDQKILTISPKQRNPNNEIGFEKSLYFAIKYIMFGGVRNRVSYAKNLAHQTTNYRVIQQVVYSDSSIKQMIDTYKKTDDDQLSKPKKDTPPKTKTKKSINNNDDDHSSYTLKTEKSKTTAKSSKIIKTNKTKKI